MAQSLPELPLVPLGGEDSPAVVTPAVPSALRPAAKGTPASLAATRVVSINPPSGASGQLESTNIVVQFNNPIDPLTVNASSFQVAGAARGPYPGNFSFASRNSEITFTPSGPFDRGETVLINVSSQIKDTLGDAIGPWASRFTVRSETNAAEFAQGVAYGVGQLPLAITTCDLNRDGNLDLIVGNTSWQGSGTSKTISVLMGLGNGVFGPKTDYVTDTAAAPLPLGVSAGDLDGDGYPEIVVANRGSDTVAVFRNNGAGVFGMAQLHPVAGAPVEARIGDLDGDGRADIAVSHGGLAGGGEGVSLLFGNGDGTFAAPVYLNTGLRHWGLRLCDLNGDGRLDMATADSGSGTLSVIVNLGERAFAPAVSYPAGGTPRGLAVGDFNGDGWPDLVAAGQFSYSVTFYTNNGDGTFSGRTDLLVNGQPVGVEVADFDGDGWDEIATANHFGGTIYNSRSVTVWHNNHGVFDLHKEINVGYSQPIALVAGDFDNDGDPDLATANWSGGSVAILKNAPASLAGWAYFDANEDCTENGPDEFRVAERLIRVTDNSSGVTRYVITRQDGAFAAVVPAGSYRVNLVHNASTIETCYNGQGTNYNVTVMDGVRPAAWSSASGQVAQRR